MRLSRPFRSWPLRLRRRAEAPPAPADDDAAGQTAAQDAAPRPSQPPRLSWRQLGQLPVTMLLASVLAGLGAVQMTFLIGNSLYRTYTRTQATVQARADVQKLQQDLTILKAAQAHADDPDELRAQARCLGFVGEGERVVVAQGATETSGGNCDPVRLP